MAPVAYGALMLKPWEFGRLTVGEFRALVQGYEWREENRRIAWAQFVVPAINACSRNLKKPVTLETILGYDPAQRQREKANENKSGTQLKEELAELMQEMGVQ